jgi:hypothetical protein
MRGRKEPLYRKVNTRTRGVHHHKGGRARWERGTKAATQNEAQRGSMHAGGQNGLDYTPLFRFLLSKVGEEPILTAAGPMTPSAALSGFPLSELIPPELPPV